MQNIFFILSKITHYSKLLFPIICTFSLWVAYQSLKEPYVVHEMPTITVDKDGNVVVWQGQDFESIRNYAIKKSQGIISTLYSNSDNESIVRNKITEGLKNFSKSNKSSLEAQKVFSKQGYLAIDLAKNHSQTSFVTSKERILYLEQKWVTETTGTFIKTDHNETQTGEKLRISIAFKMAEGEQRNELRKPLIIESMEIKRI